MDGSKSIDENLLCGFPKVVNNLFLQRIIRPVFFQFSFTIKELHAHLNGSLSGVTMQKLSQLKYGPNDVNLKEYQLLDSINIHE